MKNSCFYNHDMEVFYLPSKDKCLMFKKIGFESATYPPFLQDVMKYHGFF